MFLGTRLIPFFGSSDVSAVVEAYYHALFAAQPRRRYVVGLDAQLMWLASLLPSSVLDLVFLSPLLRAVPASCRRWTNAAVASQFVLFAAVLTGWNAFLRPCDCFWSAWVFNLKVLTVKNRKIKIDVNVSSGRSIWYSNFHFRSTASDG